MSFPRVLIVALGRINRVDTYNNGLLLRNLFGGWPRENLAQIYSSGDSGDEGFFGNYYQLGPDDRRLGGLFFRLKAGDQQPKADAIASETSGNQTPGIMSRFKTTLKGLLMDTGVYELIFRPRISRQMMDWVREFKPDIIFAQGYNLTFTWLPVLLKQETGGRLALLSTDDWPTYLYSGQLGESKLFCWLLRPAVVEAAQRLMAAVDIPFAFGQPMACEYQARYGKEFVVMSHSDDRKRFDDAEPLRIHEKPIRTIVAIGYFNAYRWPLFQDVNECCRLLENQGIQVRVALISCGIDPEGERALANCSYVDILPDPGNELLPAYLKGADLLFLAEGFDEGWVSSIRLSISSKSHLYMFSRRPIIVYAHPDCGVSKYAATEQWGVVVSKRNIELLASAISQIITNAETAKLLISRADETADINHVREASQAKFIKALTLVNE
jgi:glycosyltransferase involved in cell wall biosynthesis